MENRYKIIISNKNLYKEFELPTDKKEVKVGTNVGCDFRLHRDLFFEQVEFTFVKNAEVWSLFCSDNLYVSVGDSRKLMTLSLKHGDTFFVKYQESDSEVFTVEFLIDFDNSKRKYERAIDVSGSTNIRIGSDSSSQIKLNSTYIKNDLIELQRSAKGYDLRIKQTTYGVYLNGSKVTNNCTVKNGDFFSVSDFIFYYKNSVIWTEIRDGLTVNGLSFADYPNPNNYPKFSRNTRVRTVLNKDKIEVLDPPAKPQKTRSNLLMSLLPSLGMLVTSGLMASMGGSMVIFSIISGGMAIVTAVMTAIQNKADFKKESKERIEKYHKYADNKRLEITEYRNEERDSLEQIYTDLPTEQSLFMNFSSDLFDRQAQDDDFLQVRLGLGSIKPARNVEYKKQERLEVEDDLQLIPEKISDEFSVLADAPVVCNFKDSNSVGIIGKEEYRFSIMKNIIIDICARQYYTDVQLFFVATENHKDKVKWLRFLPHVSNEVNNSRNIVCDDESKNRTFDFLFKELSQREQGKKGQHIVVFFYDECGFQTHPISKFTNKLKDLSVTFVFMADTKGEIPQGCSSLIWVDSLSSGTLVNSSNQDEKIAFTFNSIDDKDAQQIVNLLAPVYTEEISLEGSLTKNISLFEMFNILVVDDLDLEQRWANSKVFQSMAAPIGVTKTGIISLDLHDKAHGPHGLVAGTTGSGKSEVLQTYILSIATIFHPYEVAFVIIDFKGGGMVNQFKNLPHLLGAITNIDGKEIDRSLKSIKAELQKRQRLFAEAEVNHIDKYIQKYKAGQVTTPIPHLILIVDEFAELKAEQPEFMKELISAARIGRSLGVHLILATQKPSGQVDDQIWSNSRFKLCLKVQSQEDSNEVLKSPLAAEIKEPGRAYLQVGNNEVFELFQSAYSGAPDKMADTNIKEFVLCEVNESGKRSPIFVQKKKKATGSNFTQLESIVEYVSNYCEQKGIERLANICLPPLPTMIAYPEMLVKNNAMVKIGVYDDPDNQVQEAAALDLDNKNTLIIGSSQYGKTNVLQSFIRSITSSSTPNEATIYILDFGSMVLKNFESLNHVGGVVCSSEDEKLKNLFKLLFAEISSRKEKLVSVGVSSYSSYLEAGYTDLPHIYLMVDNLTALIELYLEDDDSLLNIVREGISVGISTIIANSQTAGVGYKYLSNFANKIALYCNDSAEYTNIFDHASLQPDDVAGRCVLEIDKRMLECQTYLAFDGVKEIERVQQMQKFIAEVNGRCEGMKAKPIPCIPTLLTEESMKQDFNAISDGYKLPLGLTYSEVQPFYLDFSLLGIMGLCGKENTGHKNFVQYVLGAFESNREKYPVRVAIFDDVTRKYECFKNNPIVDTYTLDVEQVADTIQDWHTILSERYNNLIEESSIGENSELLLMIVQNNDIAKKIGDDFDLMEQFNEMISRFKGMNVAIIFSNYNNVSLSYDAPEPLRLIKEQQHIIFFEDLDNLKPFEVPYEELKANRKRLETGDAYYIEDNMVTKLKIVKSNPSEG